MPTKLRMNFLKSIGIALLLALMPMQSSLAADSDPTPVEAGGFFEKMDGAIRDVGKTAGAKLGESLKDSGKSMAASVTGTALQIAGGLALVYLLYEVLQFLSGRSKSMLQVLFDVGIPCIFAAAFIVNYPDMIERFDGLLNVFRNLGKH